MEDQAHGDPASASELVRAMTMTRFGGFSLEEVETLSIALGNDPGFADKHGLVDALLEEVDEELENAKKIRDLIGKREQKDG